jgi:hypothetical protein
MPDDDPTPLIHALYAPLVEALLATQHEPSIQERAAKILRHILAGRAAKLGVALKSKG